MGVKLMSMSGSSTRLEYWTNPVSLSELRMTKIRLDNFTAPMRYYAEEEECQLCLSSTAKFSLLELNHATSTPLIFRWQIRKIISFHIK